MRKNIFNIKYLALGALVSLGACVSDDLADVGDLEDFSGPTPFYSVTDVTTSEFDCNKVELEANYDFNFEAGSNLAVNGTNYLWTVTPSEGVTLINKDVPVFEKLIDAENATVVAIEEDIAALEFDIPCEDDADKLVVMEAELVGLQADLLVAQASISEESAAIIAGYQESLANLAEGTLTDPEVIFSFPTPGVYTVGLTVTDNLGKSAYTERTTTVIQAVPTIPTPEIGEPGFDDGTLFDGTGDGRDSWRSPSSSSWGSVFQINSKTELGVLPDGLQAAKFPADGSRTGYQEIDVTPGATYVLTYFTELDTTAGFGDVTVSIVSTEASSLLEAQEEANIIASRTDDNEGRTDDVFKSHAITFEAGEHESVIILITNTGVESRLDAFDIIVKQ